jgi:SAM-dependent methyltransferase
MEHIEDDRAVFRHFERVLRPGGEVIINTPSDQGGSAVAQEGGESFIGEHVRDGYGTDEIREKLVSAGLEPTEIAYTYGRFGSAAWRLLIQIPMRLLGTGFWTVPLVVLFYIPAFPLGMALNALDMMRRNPVGTGLIVRARKPL